MRLDYNVIALTELEWYQLFYLVAKPTTRLPVSVLGSPVECGVQSKLLLLQFSGQANYRQRVEHSGMSIFNDLFPLISLSKHSGIKVGGGGEGGRKGVGCCVGEAVLRDNLVYQLGWQWKLATVRFSKAASVSSASLLIELIENRRSPSFHQSDERLTLETLPLETL